MKSFIILIISLTLVGEVFGVACKPHSKTDDLSFVDPEGLSYSNYPAPVLNGIYGKAKEVHCCATGFDRITWTVNGTDPGPADISTHEFYQDGQRLFYQKIPAGDTVFKCTLHAENGETIEHNITVSTDKLWKTPRGPVYFTKLAQDQCAEPGDNVTAHCQLQLPENDTTFFLVRRILFKVADQYYSISVSNHYSWTSSFNDTTNLLDGYGYFINITEDQLNVTYSCVYQAYKKAHYNFTIKRGPCGPIPRELIEVVDGRSGLIVGLTILGFLIILIISTALLIVFHTEARIWWIKNVLTLFSNLGEKIQYDIFMVYADSDDSSTLDVITTLDNEFKVCLPDRDFEFGTIVPQETISKLKSSQFVVIILNNKIFDTESWLDAQIKMSLRVQRPVIFIRTERLHQEEINKRPYLRAGIKVCTTLDYKSDSEAEFNKTLHNLLPAPNVRYKNQPVEHEDMGDKKLNEETDSDIKLDQV